jgi:hypothetical protein
MAKYGEWDDGCFYYNKTAAPELTILIAKAKALAPSPVSEKETAS